MDRMVDWFLHLSGFFQGLLIFWVFICIANIGTSNVKGDK